MRADSARVSVTVHVPPALAFEVFTRDIDRWWRRGIQYRAAGRRSGLVCLEAKIGGRLFESIDAENGTLVFEVGRISVWDPPQRLVFSWRNASYDDGQHTEVEVEFAAIENGTRLTVTHRGLASLQDDHPARHGLAQTEFLRMVGLWWGEQMTSLVSWSDAL